MNNKYTVMKTLITLIALIIYGLIFYLLGKYNPQFDIMEGNEKAIILWYNNKNTRVYKIIWKFN